MIAGMFILSGALGKTGLVPKMKTLMVKHSGKGQLIVFAYMLTCVVIIQFSMPTALISMFLPFMAAFDQKSRVQPAHLLFPGAVLAPVSYTHLDMGGWTNPDMPGYFLEYSKIVMDAFHGRVRKWITLNEPYCAAFLGNYEGRQAPGLRDFSAAVQVAYHLYVGHGLAVRYFRNQGYEGEIGITLNLMGRLPLTDSQEDRAAAARADGYLNRWFAEPIVFGRYPEDMVGLYRSKGVRLPEFKEEHMKLMGQKLDFIGLNYYNDFYVKADPHEMCIRDSGHTVHIHPGRLWTEPV